MHIIHCNFISLISASLFTLHSLYTPPNLYYVAFNANITFPTAALLLFTPQLMKHEVAFIVKQSQEL